MKKLLVTFMCLFVMGSFSASHPEYIINIVQDGEVVYSSLVSEGVTQHVLPSYLNGEYTIQLITGNFCFYGIIEL